MTEDVIRSQIVSISDLEWQQARPLVKMKTVWEDKESGRKAVLIRFEPGAELPLHRHKGDEYSFVIEGAISDEAGTTTAGNFTIRPNGCVHRVTSKNGATCFAVISGTTEPIEG